MKYFRLILLTFLTVLWAGCEDALDPKRESTYPDDDTWRLPDKAKGVLYNGYAAMGGKIDGYGDNFLDCATDNAVTNDYSSGVYRLGQGGMSALSNPLDTWQMAYAQFKNIHLFLENGLGDHIRYYVQSDSQDQRFKRKYKGEAFFLRAWWGWQLLRVYGGKTASGEVLGYPIVLDSNDGYEERPRNTYEECVERIIADLDSAIVYLPLDYDSGNDPIVGSSGRGKASGASSYALRAIVYLQAASDAYQPDGVTDGERQFKWIRAAHAANQAIRLAITTPDGITASAFGGTSNTISAEFILGTSLGNTNSFETKNFVAYNFGQARTNPSQNLVDAFGMSNGYPIGHPGSNYDPANPYAGRDPRLELTVYHDGSAFKTGVGSSARVIEVFNGGKDSPSSDTRATRTGYYLRKWIVESVELKPGSVSTAYHFAPMIRKTEVWLAFAEAANQAWGPKYADPAYIEPFQGSVLTACDAIHMIRSRASITDTRYPEEVALLGKEAFDTFILDERRIELAFENHRYFDLRRRMLFAPMREAIRGVEIESTTDGPAYREKTVEQRPFNDPKYIYSPIPYDEVRKNPEMIQNLGWE